MKNHIGWFQSDKDLTHTTNYFFPIGQFEEQRIEQWQVSWAEKGEKRAVAHRKMLEAALKHPDNPPEVALQVSLQVRIRTHTCERDDWLFVVMVAHKHNIHPSNLMNLETWNH